MDKKEFLGLLSKKARVDRPEKKVSTLTTMSLPHFVSPLYHLSQKRLTLPLQTLATA
jgi:hypothetical protein